MGLASKARAPKGTPGRQSSKQAKAAKRAAKVETTEPPEEDKAAKKKAAKAAFLAAEAAAMDTEAIEVTAAKAAKAAKAEKAGSAKKGKASKQDDKIPTPADMDADVAEAVAEAEQEMEADAKVSKKSKAHRLEQMEAEEPKVPRGVIYIGHLPNGFFEPQMHKFFKQFGKVTRLRISRSKKNARSKGYAFIEFEDEAVAKIVSETMSKYMLFGKTLVCHVVPPEKQHPALFHNCNKRMRNLQPLRQRNARTQYNDRPALEVDGELVPQTTTRQVSRRAMADRKLQSMLANLGVDYKLGAEEAAPDASTKKRKAEPEAPAPAPPMKAMKKKA